MRSDGNALQGTDGDALYRELMGMRYRLYVEYFRGRSAAATTLGSESDPASARSEQFTTAADGRFERVRGLHTKHPCIPPTVLLLPSPIDVRDNLELFISGDLPYVQSCWLSRDHVMARAAPYPRRVFFTAVR